MKKILLPFVVLMLSVVACQKEDEGVLKVKIEQYTSNSKVHLDNDKYALWDDGDAIYINGDQAAVSINAGTATISGFNSSSTGYTAIYPYESGSTFPGDITYLPNQVYRTTSFGHQILDAPMAAYCGAEDNELVFHNLGAILSLHLDLMGVVNFTISKIEVTNVHESEEALAGTYDLNIDNGETTLGNSHWEYGTLNKVTLDCSEAWLSALSASEVCIALPPVSNARLRIRVYSTDGYYYEVNQTENISIAANYIYNATVRCCDANRHANSSSSFPVPENGIILYKTNNGQPLSGEHTPGEDGYYEIRFAGNIVYPYTLSLNSSNSGSLTSIIFPADVQHISASFTDCSNLETVACYSNDVYVESDLFGESTSGATLHLPQGSHSMFWEIAGWVGQILYDL